MADDYYPQDTVENQADGRSYWYQNHLRGEQLDPNALGIYGTPNPTGYQDRTPSVRSDESDRMMRELWNRDRAGQLGNRDDYVGWASNPNYSDETIRDALHRVNPRSYLTNISDSGGGAPSFDKDELMPPEREKVLRSLNELEGEPNRSRFQAYRDWQNQATPEELRDQALEGGYHTPTSPNLGYAEGEIIPQLDMMRQRGDEAIIQEKTNRAAAGEPRRDEELPNALALQRERYEKNRGNLVLPEKGSLLTQFVGEPISDQRTDQNYLSGALSSAADRLHPLESYMMDQLENSPDIGFQARNNFPHDQLVDMIMRKYGLGETGRQHAEDYATELRMFSNPGNYRNYEPQEGISKGPGARVPFEEQRRLRLESDSPQGYQPISDVRPNLALPDDQGNIPYRRLPLASGIAPLPNASGYDPLIDLQGSVGPLGRRNDREPLNFRAMYRRNIPF